MTAGGARGAERPRRRGGARGAACRGTDILEVTLVGNPIMHHLVLGIDPVELGGAPFALATDERSRCAARESTSSCIRARVLHAALHCRPCGRRRRRHHPRRAPRPVRQADAAGRRRHQCRDRARQPRSACSPARARPGPAFEGAQISCGQRAAPGAIERVRIDPATLEPRFKVIGSDLWSDEPGFEARRGAHRRHRHLRLRHHRGDRRDVPGRHHQPGRRRRRGARRAQRSHRGHAGALSPIRAIAARCRCRSPRTTCARSSSPRLRSMRACGC